MQYISRKCISPCTYYYCSYLCLQRYVYFTPNEISDIFINRVVNRLVHFYKNENIFQQLKYNAIEGILTYQEECEKESGSSLEHFLDVMTQNVDLDRNAKCFAYCILRKNGLIDNHVNPNDDKINEWFADDNSTQIINEQWRAKCSDFKKDDLCEAAFLLLGCLPYE